MLNYQVLEDNGGGIHLFVFEGEEAKVIFAHSGYNSLIEDIAELKKGGHPIHDGWDGNIDPEEYECSTLDEYYDLIRYYVDSYNITTPIVADQNGIYPEKMGASAHKAFGIEVDE